MNRPSTTVILTLALTAACVADDDHDHPTGPRSSSGGTDAGREIFDAPVDFFHPPPVITSMAPLAGDYGVEVTLVGEHFDPQTPKTNDARLVLDGPGGPITIDRPSVGVQPKPTDVVVAWSDTSITIKYPFPAKGVVRVTTLGGSAEGPAFEPSVDPGSPLAGTFTRREWLATVSPSTGRFVLAFDGDTGPKLVDADLATGALASRPLPRGDVVLRNLSLYVDGSGDVGGFYEEGTKLVHLTSVLGTAVATTTAVAAEVVAGGADASGPYAWVRNAGSPIARVRPPGFTAETTVTDPTPASAPGPSMAVAFDDSLFVGWGVNDSHILDDTAFPHVRRLRVSQTTFDHVVQVGGHADDYMLWTRFRPGPEGRVASYYCADDTGFGSPVLECQEGYAGSSTQTPSNTLVSEYVVGWSETATYAAVCRRDSATLHFGPEGQAAEQIPWLFPCPRIVAVAVDGTGKPLLLVDHDGMLYNPRRP